MDDGGYNHKISQCLVADGHCCALAAQKQDPALSCTQWAVTEKKTPNHRGRVTTAATQWPQNPPNQKLQVSPSLNHAACLQPCPDKPAERPGSFPRVFPVSPFLTQPVAFEPRTPWFHLSPPPPHLAGYCSNFHFSILPRVSLERQFIS